MLNIAQLLDLDDETVARLVKVSEVRTDAAMEIHDALAARFASRERVKVTEVMSALMEQVRSAQQGVDPEFWRKSRTRGEADAAKGRVADQEA